MKEALTNLLKIKSLVTLALTATFIVVIIMGNELPQPLIDIYLTIIGFYFGTQFGGKNGKDNTEV
jgi:hypothetical protein